MFALSYIPNLPKDIQVLLKLPIVMAFTIFLASLSHYSYTTWNFTAIEKIEDVADSMYSKELYIAITNGKFRVLGNVFIGTCIVVSVTILGIYFLAG
jgi:hypothetical protein